MSLQELAPVETPTPSPKPATKRTRGRRGTQPIEKASTRKQKRARQAQKKAAQDALWYQALLESGICILGGDKYSMTLRLDDINYQMATEDLQRDLLEKYARFFNMFASGEQLQVTIVNRRVERDTLLAKVLFPEPRHGDRVTFARTDHNHIVRGKIGDSQYSIVAEKFLTLTVTATSLEHAKATLRRRCEMVITQMGRLLECRATIVDGVGRVELLRELTRGCYTPGFDFAGLAASGATTHDELAPTVADFTNPNTAVLTGDAEELHYQTLVMRSYPTWLRDTLLEKLAEVQADLVISLHVDPIDKAEARELVLRRKAELDMERSDKTRAINKRGGHPEYDLPHRLSMALEEIGDLLEDIEKSDQRLFTTTLVVAVRARSAEELAERVDQVRQVAKGESCDLAPLKFFQAQGLNTALPFGESYIPIRRTLTTAAVAVLVPFTSQEVLDDDGLFYGTNTATGNPIIADRRRTRNGNAFILGTSGSGKSHFAKWEMTEVIVGRPNDEVIIIDPENEYRPLADAFGASIVDVHAGSDAVINPFDLVMHSLEGDPVKQKTDSLLGMLRVLLGGLSSAQVSILDRSITALYARYLTEPDTVPVPTLRTLREELLRQPEAEAHAMATSLELYATGTYSGFAQQTNVDTTNRFVYYDISRLGEHMKTFGMMVVLDSVWNRVVANYGRNIRTWLYVDEFHLMLLNDYALQMFLSIYKRARKYGLLPTGITQNVEEILAVHEARLMLNNSDVLFLLGQKQADADALADQLSLSEDQIRAFMAVDPGCGLMRFGATTLAFNARKPETGPLAELFSTTFEDK
jgi:hypothetical protein